METCSSRASTLSSLASRTQPFFRATDVTVGGVVLLFALTFERFVRSNVDYKPLIRAVWRNSCRRVIGVRG
jgi:hypothetical protein